MFAGWGRALRGVGHDQSADLFAEHGPGGRVQAGVGDENYSAHGGLHRALARARLKDRTAVVRWPMAPDGQLCGSVSAASVVSAR
ncbi:hypothetical protein GCM10009759_32500 [Kitasatospora saccharophila]|uniref:Uncharacterized protein n=1 Tax=Kitasatospora saccharophila TaxID=407973 RepID=A0ABN2WX17_9ACTN